MEPKLEMHCPSSFKVGGAFASPPAAPPPAFRDSDRMRLIRAALVDIQTAPMTLVNMGVYYRLLARK